ncbi:MAG: glycoside hydrolase family 2 TIM barrel-domain containing protein [Tepidisphaeraceae bacterium]
MPDPLRQTLRMLDGWRFHLGDDVVPPLANTHIAAYMAAKAGSARGAARPGYDDSDWRGVQLPHDWSIEGAFDPDNHMDAGYLPRGVGWYRRHFKLDDAARGRRFALRFEGVSSHCTVWVNGHLLHRHFDGYTPFEIDFTDVASFGDDVNTVAVRVEATSPEGWWYEGAGIYRDVWLIDRPATSLDREGAFVYPHVLSGPDVPMQHQGSWGVFAMTSFKTRASDRPRELSFVGTLLDPRGEVVTSQRQAIRVPAGTTTRPLAWKGHAGRPELWSVDTPHLYTLRLELSEGDTLIDRADVRFGFRSIRFDANDGFFLNDQPLKLKGACVHQDHAGVGVAVPASIQRFRVQRLKDMGCNAVRAGHHALDPAFMDACDELGLLALAENRHFGTSPWHREMLTALITRDRNRPSVFAWSLCNEEPMQGTVIGQQIARTMKAWAKDLDPSRPVTAAVSGGILNDVGIAHELDVMSINYQLHLHEPFHAKHPTKAILAAETGCVYATRGVTQTVGQHFADDDTQFATWGHSARAAWEAVSGRPYVAGLFVWTGFDYRGEPTPHAWPSVQSHWGVMDLCGFDKAATVRHREFFGVPARDEMPMSDEPAVALGLEVHPSFDVASIPADGRFAIPVTVFAIDASGKPVRSSQTRTRIEVSGEGRLLGTGNGDPTCHEPNTGAERSLFKGLAQAIVQTTTVAGEIVVSVQAGGLRPARLVLKSQPATNDRVAPARRRLLIDNWRMSPVSATPIDLALVPSEQDMNSWERVQCTSSGQTTWANENGFALYRATFDLPKSSRVTGASVRLSNAAGVIAAAIDGHAVDVTNDIVRVSPGEGKRAISLLVERKTTEKVGLFAPPEILTPA